MHNKEKEFINKIWDDYVKNPNRFTDYISIPVQLPIQTIIQNLYNKIHIEESTGIRPRRIGQRGEPIEKEINVNLYDLRRVLKYIDSLDDQLTKAYDEKL